jgi:hypothetical protein
LLKDDSNETLFQWCLKRKVKTRKCTQN